MSEDEILGLQLATSTQAAFRNMFRDTVGAKDQRGGRIDTGGLIKDDNLRIDPRKIIGKNVDVRGMTQVRNPSPSFPQQNPFQQQRGPSVETIYGNVPETFQQESIPQLQILPMIDPKTGQNMMSPELIQRYQNNEHHPDNSFTNLQNVRQFEVPNYGSVAQPIGNDNDDDKLDLVLKEIRSVKRLVNKLIKAFEGGKVNTTINEEDEKPEKVEKPIPVQKPSLSEILNDTQFQA